ncbi:putative uncharacterized protein CXorf58 homolog [Cricetulus griseus]|uniref:Uncharacterized protein n=1 Tax=Cricetulus griseus TaxID=10029 RepID=A0A9J7GJV9_CRIGR|nr:putative uncharacterized protein CXorf58 homolog [Cricetulus griseus]XP_027294627.1 putative uncharacterized protein CXorf58 homolog [Cricetulus griseus]
MKKSSNTTGTDAPKSDSQLPEKIHKTQSARAAKIKARKVNREISATKIQKAWFIYVDKTLFKLLKHTVCAAEYCVAHELLKKVSPIEAALVKDPSMKCKVRFRFGGETFPPFIVFKIFFKNDGHGYKYFSGKDLLKPSSKAVADACKIMGERKFCQQIMEDEHCFQKFKVADPMDIVTAQDYMQYCSLLDETPASSGGKNNHWRRLNLKSIPKTMMMYDIVDYAESGVISNRLQKEMKYLLQKPQTEAMRQHQLEIVSKVRYPSITTVRPFYQPWEQQGKMKHLGRRSKQAQKKVEKMKKAYKAAKEEKASSQEAEADRLQTKEKKVIFYSPAFDIVAIEEPPTDTTLEKEEKELFAWYQDLYVKHSSLF